MKKFALCLALVVPFAVLAQPLLLDAGSPDAGVVVPDLTQAISAADAIGTNPFASMRAAYVAIKTGQGWVGAALLLILSVSLIRVAGKKLHDIIPDDSPLDAPFIFIFDTKVGGWTLNWATTLAGCLLFSIQAGMAVDAEAWKTAFLASTSGTAVIELIKDISEWWVARQAKKAAEVAAKAAALAATPAPVVAVAPEAPVVPPVEPTTK